jgi:hypothetical protein
LRFRASCSADAIRRFPEAPARYYFPTWRFDVWFASVAAVPVIGDVLRYTISPISSWLGLPFFVLTPAASHSDKIEFLLRVNPRTNGKFVGTTLEFSSSGDS